MSDSRWLLLPALLLATAGGCSGQGASRAGVFLGTSQVSNTARVGWLLWLDPSGPDAAYFAGATQPVCDWSLRADTLTWSTANFRFAGIRAGGSWEGSIGRTGQEWPTTIDSLEGLDSSPDARVGRLYSSLRVHAETGDLLGEEVVLLETPRGLVGLVSIVEGSATLPWVSADVRMVGDSLSLSVTPDYARMPVEVGGIFADAGLQLRVGVRERAFLSDRGPIVDVLRQGARACN